MPPCPPFTQETAIQKVRMAENAWNTRNPERVALAYTPTTRWRNRQQFLRGRGEVVAFLKRKWQMENHYRLIKSLWSWSEKRLAVRFAYEWCDDKGQWWRSYGNENWQFSSNGQMEERHASINDSPILETERLLSWKEGPRPEHFPSMEELGL